jgi:hypothetical protein
MTSLRYVVFLLVAAGAVVVALQVKVVPLCLLALLFMAHGVLTWARRGRITSRGRDTFSAVLLLGCFLLSSTAAATALAELVTAPSHEGHPVMPIGEVLFGIIAGTGTTALLGVAALGRRRDRSRERIVIHLVGAGVVAVAIFKAIVELGNPA